MCDFYICYFSAIFDGTNYTFAWNKWKKAQKLDTKLKISSDRRWQGCGSSCCQKCKTGNKRKSAALIKWESGGVAPGILACVAKWKGARYWLEEHKVLAFSSTSWEKSFSSPTSMFYVATLNWLLLEFIFHILVYNLLKKEASVFLKCLHSLPPLPMGKKNLNF